jgi:hypothetical protein
MVGTRCSAFTTPRSAQVQLGNFPGALNDLVTSAGEESQDLSLNISLNGPTALEHQPVVTSFTTWFRDLLFSGQVCSQATGHH